MPIWGPSEYFVPIFAQKIEQVGTLFQFPVSTGACSLGCMSAVPFVLTPEPVRITTTGVLSLYQPIYEAFDVQAFDSFDLIMEVWYEAPATPTLTAYIKTGASAEVDANWMAVGSQFPNVGTSGGVSKMNINGNFLRYIRWFVFGMTNSSAAIFRISGMARRA